MKVVDVEEGQFKGFQGKTFNYDEFNVELSNVEWTSDADETLKPHSDDINAWIKENAEKVIKNTTARIDAGDFSVYLNLPISLLLPISTLYYASHMSQDVIITPNYIEY